MRRVGSDDLVEYRAEEKARGLLSQTERRDKPRSRKRNASPLLFNG